MRLLSRVGFPVKSPPRSAASRWRSGFVTGVVARGTWVIHDGTLFRRRSFGYGALTVKRLLGGRLEKRVGGVVGEESEGVADLWSRGVLD
jgi:hypothetical protein